MVLRAGRHHPPQIKAPPGEMAVLERYAEAAERAGEQPMEHLVKRLNAARLPNRIASTLSVEGYQ